MEGKYTGAGNAGQVPGQRVMSRDELWFCSLSDCNWNEEPSSLSTWLYHCKFVTNSTLGRVDIQLASFR